MALSNNLILSPLLWGAAERQCPTTVFGGVCLVPQISRSGSSPALIQVLSGFLEYLSDFSPALSDFFSGCLGFAVEGEGGSNWCDFAQIAIYVRMAAESHQLLPCKVSAGTPIPACHPSPET